LHLVAEPILKTPHRNHAHMLSATLVIGTGPAPRCGSGSVEQSASRRRPIQERRPRRVVDGASMVSAGKGCSMRNLQEGAHLRCCFPPPAARESRILGTYFMPRGASPGRPVDH
jgi:hypothetical protein